MSPQPFPGQATLAEYMGVTDRSIRSWLTELQDAGWLEVRREPTKKGRRNSYRLFWKQTSEPVVVPQDDRNQASGNKRKQASGRYRKPASYEEEPCEAEPVEEETPAVVIGAQVELFRDSPVEPPVPAKPSVVAKLILDDWWSRQDPKPQQKYVAILGVLRKALETGWDERDLSEALDSVPTMSGPALDFWRNTRNKKNGAAWLSTKSADQQADESMTRLKDLMGTN